MTAIFKEASRRKLRFSTNRGSLSVEQLWDLKDSELKMLVRQQYELNKKNQGTDELDFLEAEVVDKDSDDTLRFEILKDIYTTKKAERDNAKDEAAKRAHNQKIMELIAKKQEEEMAGKSIEELQAMLK